MELYAKVQRLFPHVSVDCVIFGFDGSMLKVLLMDMKSNGRPGEFNNYKFPGSMIYANENLDEAMQRAVYSITGLKSVAMRQFKTFGCPHRSSNPRDVRWLSGTAHQITGRIVTVGYIAIIKMNRRIVSASTEYDMRWVSISDTPMPLAFDHPLILMEALKEIRRQVVYNPVVVFDLLPQKFTARQLRAAYEVLFNRTYDVRNFYKKFVENKSHIVALEEKERNVTHRAARYFRFNRKEYMKTHESLM